MKPLAALELAGVTVRRSGTVLLDRVSWTVGPDERWIVLGPNGAGKTTLLQLATGYLHPTVGTVDVLGRRLGHVDVRQLRERVALVSAALLKKLEPSMTALDAVLTGRHADLAAWWHEPTEAERAAAAELLDRAGLGYAAGRPLSVLSEGERQQVQLARALIAGPELLLLDEAAAGLDLAARERLVGTLAALASDPSAPPMVFVTHHVEEIPRGFTHCLLLRAGGVVATGPLRAVLTAASLSTAFGLPLELSHDRGRFTSRTPD